MWHTNVIGRLPARSTILALAFAGALMGAVGNVRADDLMVKYDQAQLLRLPRPVADIIIGNPSIADITVQQGNLLVITGKTFGITNIIALDAQGQVIQDQRIMVYRESEKVVNLQRGKTRQSYNCNPQCQTTITVGDDSEYLKTTLESSERKMKISAGAADPGGGGGGSGGN